MMDDSMISFDTSSGGMYVGPRPTVLIVWGAKTALMVDHPCLIARICLSKHWMGTVPL
jgi:hypothetical protein